MKIISVNGRKGGIGKTLMAKTLAAACARAGLRTVLVDADGQGNASQGVRVKPHDAFYELVINDAEFGDVLRPVPLEFHGHGELWLLSTWMRQLDLELERSTTARIVERFPELNGWADVVIVDTSPGVTPVHAGFFYTADYVLLPTLCDMPSVTSLNSTFSYLASAAEAGQAAGYPTAQVLGIIPNCFSGKEKVQQVNLGIVIGRYGERHRVFNVMRNLTVWRQADQLRCSIFMMQEDADYQTRRQSRAAAHEFQPILDAVLSVTEKAHV